MDIDDVCKSSVANTTMIEEMLEHTYQLSKNGRI